MFVCLFVSVCFFACLFVCLFVCLSSIYCDRQRASTMPAAPLTQYWCFMHVVFKHLAQELGRAISTSIIVRASSSSCPTCSPCPSCSSSADFSSILTVLQSRCGSEVAISGWQAAAALILAVAIGVLLGGLFVPAAVNSRSSLRKGAGPPVGGG